MVNPTDDAAWEAHQLAETCRRWRLVALISSVAGVTLFFALIGAILCHSAAVSVAQGNTDDARSKLRWGQGLTLAGVSIAMLTFVAYFATR